MRKNSTKLVRILWVLLALVGLSVVGQQLLKSPDVVQAAAPTPENTVSAAGWQILGGIVISNGITAQPSDVNAIKAPTTTISFTAMHKDDVGFSGSILKNATVREYVNGSWNNVPTGFNRTKPNNYSANVALTFNDLAVGTHYYQIAVTYVNWLGITVDTKYSRVVTVNIAPQPVDATAIAPTATPATIFWGQTTSLDAHLTPANSTATVSWAFGDSSLGAFSNSTGIQTNFTSTLSPTDDNLKQAAGVVSTATATATNSGGGKLSGGAQVTIGGLTKQNVIEGDTLTYYPPALDTMTPPTGAGVSYKWQIYDSNYKLLSNPGGTVAGNGKTLTWTNVPMPSSSIYYLKLNITITKDNQSAIWQSNYAPLTVEPAVVKLIAVPNLLFNKFDGTNYTTPSIQDFYNPAGLTLNYVPKRNVKASTNYDGNNNDLLAVSGKKWTLTVGFSPFRNMDDQNYLSSDKGGTAQFNLNVNGKSFLASDNNTPVTLFTNSADSYTGSLNNSTTLKIPQVKTVTPGTYQSTATWTLIKAP
ncbi:MAG: hypothetical protein LKF36_02145 [Lactobacillus sp.]|jgi:hypothetical protein|nr:hypothetical protein [Lactobacillus sp.]